MGVCTAGHLPAVTSTSYPSLTSHLLASFNAQRVGPWNVTIRMLRSVITSGSTEDGSTAIKTTKLMYVVQMSEYPDETFVLVEDPQRETRASIRTRHTFAVMQAAVEAQQNAATAAAAAAATESAEAPPTDTAAETKPDPAVENGIPEHQVGSTEEQPQHAVLSSTNANRSDGALPTSQPNENSQMDSAQPPPPPPPPLSAVALPPSVTEAFAATATKPTRHTLFVVSAHYMMLLTRLNLPAPLGAPSMGDGQSTSAAAAGPGAWLPRGAPIVIQGATYDLPSSAGYGYGAGAEWRVRLGMVQSGGGTRSAGAIVQNEFLPLLRMAGDGFLTQHLHDLFPAYLITPGATPSAATSSTTAAVAAQAATTGSSQAGLVNPVPTPEQWQEVIPASNQAWMDAVGITGVAPPPADSAIGHHTNGEQKGDHDATHSARRRTTPLQQKDVIGWQGKERGRRLAYLYVTLLRNQSVI